MADSYTTNTSSNVFMNWLAQTNPEPEQCVLHVEHEPEKRLLELLHLIHDVEKERTHAPKESQRWKSRLDTPQQTRPTQLEAKLANQDPATITTFFSKFTYISRMTVTLSPTQDRTASNPVGCHAVVDGLMTDILLFLALVQSLRLEVDVHLGVPHLAALHSIFKGLSQYKQLKQVDIVMFRPSNCQEGMFPFIKSQLQGAGKEVGCAVDVEMGWYYDGDEIDVHGSEAVGSADNDSDLYSDVEGDDEDGDDVDTCCS